MIIDVHIHILSKQEIALGAEQNARRVGDRKEEEARPRAVSGYWARTLTDLSAEGHHTIGTTEFPGAIAGDVSTAIHWRR